MFATKVTAKVVQDQSGVATEIPVILTDQGVLGSVTDYVLSLHLNGISLSTITNHIQSIRLLIEFMSANEGMFDEPEALFAAFVRRSTAAPSVKMDWIPLAFIGYRPAMARYIDTSAI
jgi:hypothetical protein